MTTIDTNPEQDLFQYAHEWRHDTIYVGDTCIQDHPDRHPLPCPAPGVYENMPDDIYHRIDALNASTLKQFYKSGHHGAHYLDGEPEDPTSAMLFGTALHAALLEPDRFDEHALDTDLADACVYHKHEAVQAEHPEAIVLHRGWRDQIEAIRVMVQAHPVASRLVGDEDVRRELTLIWEESVTLDDGTVVRFMCKARLDMWNGRIQIVPDIKTTSKQYERPEKFRRHLHDMGYHQSLGWYVRGLVKAGLMTSYPDRYSSQVANIIVCVRDAPNLVFTRRIDRAMAEHGFTQLWTEAVPSYLKYRVRGERTPMIVRGAVMDNEGNPIDKTSDDLLPCHIYDWAQAENPINIGELA